MCIIQFCDALTKIGNLEINFRNYYQLNKTKELLLRQSSYE